MQPLHLFLLVFITMTLVISLMGSFQNHYRELLRVSWQWQNLQALKRFGFGHGQNQDPVPGDLALFCLACPQPGINLPEGWEYDSNESCSCCGLMLWMLPNAWVCYRWLFRRSLVADGNFTADHMKMRNPEDDVNFTHGYGYVVEEGRYKQHLSDAQEFKEVPSSQTLHLS